jgi:opacity protein-like surface antigen
MKVFSLAAIRTQAAVCVAALTTVVVTVLPGLAQTSAEVQTRAEYTTRPTKADYTRPGPYLGLGASGGLEKFNGGEGSAFGDSVGFTFRGGYRLTRNFAVEGLYEYMDDFGFSTTTFRGTRIHDDIHTHNFSLMGKAILPLGDTDQIQPYLSGGVGFVNANNTGEIRGEEVAGNSATEFAGRVGAGIDLMVTPELAVTVDGGYVLPTGNLSDLNYISYGMGLRYAF